MSIGSSLGRRVRSLSFPACLVIALVLGSCSRDGGSGAAAERLNAAMTAVEQLPYGWIDTDQPVGNFSHPRSGDGHGYCGGGNAAVRALEAGPFVAAGRRGYRTGTGSSAWASIIEFEHELFAISFMRATADTASACGQQQFTLREWFDGAEPGSGPAFIDLLPDDVALDEFWTVVGSITTGPSIERTDLVVVDQSRVFTGTVDGSPAGEKWRTIERWERHGTVVIMVGLGATHDVVLRTASDNVVATSDLPTPDELEDATRFFRDQVLDYLNQHPRPAVGSDGDSL